MNHVDQTTVSLAGSSEFVDPKSVFESKISHIEGAVAETMAQTAGAVSEAVGPVASAAMVAVTPLTASAGTLLQKISNYFEFLVYLNGKEVVLPNTILNAVGVSVIPPIFNNFMDISEEKVNCTPPSRFLDNELSCNILNNYGKEL